jgi:serine/threonine protein kinase
MSGSHEQPKGADQGRNGFAPGRTIDGIQLEERVLREGARESFKGWSVEEAGAVLVKVHHMAQTVSDEFLDKVAGEIKARNHIAGELVARVTDFGVHEKAVYLVTDWLEGTTLEAWLHHGGEEPAKEVVRICRAICAALAHCHGAGLVHGNLKPSNVLFDETFRPVLTDLALPSLWTLEADGRNLTGSSAPELRLRPALLEATQDVFAFGVLAYRILTGRDFSFGEFELPGRVRRDLGERWNEVVERCTRYGPDRRFANALEIEAALEVAAGPRVVARVVCPHCRKDTSAESLLCEHCGEELHDALDVCPKCKKYSPKKSNRCIHCNHDLSSYRSDASRYISGAFLQALELEEAGKYEAAIDQLKSVSDMQGASFDQEREQAGVMIEHLRDSARQKVGSLLEQAAKHVSAGSLSSALKVLESSDSPDETVEEMKNVCYERIEKVRRLLGAAVDAATAGHLRELERLTLEAKRKWNDSELVNVICRETLDLVATTKGARIEQLARLARAEMGHDRFQSARIHVQAAVDLDPHDPTVTALVGEFKRQRARRGYLCALLEAKQELIAGDMAAAREGLWEAAHWLPKDSPVWTELVETIRQVDAGEITADAVALARQWEQIRPYGTEKPQPIQEMVRGESPEHASAIVRALETELGETLKTDLEERAPQPAKAQEEDILLRRLHEGRQRLERSHTELPAARPMRRKPVRREARLPRKVWRLFDVMVFAITAVLILVALLFVLRGGDKKPPPPEPEPFEVPEVPPP